jgi:hypothetical protein
VANRNIARPFENAASLKRSLRRHFKALGFTRSPNGRLIPPSNSKEAIRTLHSPQRAERLRAATSFLEGKLGRILPHFANGSEIDPAKIRLVLKRVRSRTAEADIFRLATLTWSVPVSVGFGRRMRYLVWDEGHNRLVGVLALGDPVFNLAVRDKAIGWTGTDRAARLVNIMDAYVLGAVPPYNLLLGGKAIACLIRSSEVQADFTATYRKSVGIISGEKKRPALVAVTTSSSMGRSSIYNRLRLGDQQYFESVGFTAGWGHFHIPDELFEGMRNFLRHRGHIYADQHTFGEGLNWRLRTIRVAFQELGFPEEVLHHGIRREVFICHLASNAFKVLAHGARPQFSGLLSVQEISELAVQRWIIPRYPRVKDAILQWTNSEIANLIAGGAAVSAMCSLEQNSKGTCQTRAS